jgi:hypothetical protein
MQVALPWEDFRARNRRIMTRAVVSRCKMAFVCLAVLASGCASINTPLPEARPTATTALSKQDQKKAVDELAQKRETHEQDAEKEIAGSH